MSSFFPSLSFSLSFSVIYYTAALISWIFLGNCRKLVQGGLRRYRAVFSVRERVEGGFISAAFPRGPRVDLCKEGKLCNVFSYFITVPPFERGGEGGVVVCPQVLRNEIEIVPGLVEKNAFYEIVHIYIGSIPPYLWEHLLRVYRGEEGCTSSGKITVPPRGYHSR